MTNKKSKTKILVSALVALALLISLIFVSLALVGRGTVANVHAMLENVQAEQKIFSTATIDENFTDDTVLVGLTNRRSLRETVLVERSADAIDGF